MDKKFTYSFLRQEMDNLANRQDNYFSLAYASAATLWTIAISTSSGWISLIAIIIICTLSFKICDIWNGFIFISVYLKICLEGEDENDWETMRDNYYKEHPFNHKRYSIRKCLKFTFPLLNIISCIIFWAIPGQPLQTMLSSWWNVVLLIIQVVVCVGHFAFWANNYDADIVKKEITFNWKDVKEKYLHEK